MLFNEILASKEGIIGSTEIAQVLCFGQPSYESYLCLICQCWETPSNMFKHLKTKEHQLKYIASF